ncbi:ester cyclase [Microbispora sp. NPDC049125]|uniref:ester cyclase n=1 Tax=Microbispora sp. NPDC049125 TaxID=3154929 RepID=UPI003467E9A8
MRDTRELVGTLAGAITAHDDDALVGCFHPDAVLVTPLGMVEGREQLGWYYRQLYTAFPDLRYEIRRCAVHEDGVVVEWTISGTHLGPLTLPGGLEAEGSGRVVAWQGCSAYSVEEGAFVSGRIYYDQLALYRQMGHGLTPAP